MQAIADDSDGIEQRTRKQSNNKEWHYVRSFIITASHVGEITHMTDRRNKEAYAEGLVCPVPLQKPPILWGRQHEKTAKVRYEEVSHNKVIPCGLCVSKDKECPFLGASPDGLICAATVLEVKCRYSIRKSQIPVQNLHYLELRNNPRQRQTRRAGAGLITYDTPCMSLP